MLDLTNKGFNPPTPEELREMLRQEVLKKVPDFQNRPADLLNNLLDEASIFLLYDAYLTHFLFNGYSPSFSNEEFFTFFAKEVGIVRKGGYKSQVTLEFSGDVGALIPKGLGVTNALKSVKYEVEKEAFINSTGKARVVAFCDDKNIPAIGIGELNVIDLNIKGLRVTNIDTPTPPIEAESFITFKDRAQQRWRNPKAGSIGSVLNGVRAVAGVVDRTISFRQVEVMEGGKTYHAYEVVCDGGDPFEIAKALYQYGGISPKPFLSNPSNNETARSVSQNLIINGQPITYKFTRAKNVNVGIQIRISLLKVETTSASLKALTEEVFLEYVNNLRVGARPNKIGIQEVFLKGFALAKGKAENINQNAIEISVSNKDTGANIPFSAQGFLEINFDEYLTLKEFDVVVQ